jgi:hypothetical protein
LLSTWVTPNLSSITYGGDGQRLGLTDGTGTSSSGWDSLHRMVSYTNGNGAQFQWQYNLRNLTTTIIYPGSLTRGYDTAGRSTSVQDWNTNTTTQRAIRLPAALSAPATSTPAARFTTRKPVYAATEHDLAARARPDVSDNPC